MAEQHRATHHQWAKVKDLAERERVAAYSTILELLHRIEALEAAQQAKPNHPEKPDSSLVERVAAAITGDSDEPINWKPEARAAIREVAAWLQEQGKAYGSFGWGIRLEQEAEHRST